MGNKAPGLLITDNLDQVGASPAGSVARRLHAAGSSRLRARRRLAQLGANYLRDQTFIAPQTGLGVHYTKGCVNTFV